MTNNTSGINTEINVNGQKLDTVTSFKYLGSVITDEGSKPEILSRIGQTTAALTRLTRMNISQLTVAAGLIKVSLCQKATRTRSGWGEEILIETTTK